MNTVDEFKERERLFNLIREYAEANNNQRVLGRATACKDMNSIDGLQRVWNDIVADDLLKLQAAHNDGRGISCVRQIANAIKQRDIDGAKAITSIDWDKIASYPDVCEFLKKHEFAEQDWYVHD